MGELPNEISNETGLEYGQEEKEEEEMMMMMLRRIPSVFSEESQALKEATVTE